MVDSYLSTKFGLNVLDARGLMVMSSVIIIQWKILLITMMLT